jgi:hypothetical protein
MDYKQRLLEIGNNVEISLLLDVTTATVGNWLLDRSPIPTWLKLFFDKFQTLESVESILQEYDYLRNKMWDYEEVKRFKRIGNFKSFESMSRFLGYESRGSFYKTDINFIRKVLLIERIEHELERTVEKG